jgi:hypothetical protein
MQNQSVDGNGHFEGQHANGDEAEGLFEETHHRQRDRALTAIALSATMRRLS